MELELFKNGVTKKQISNYVDQIKQQVQEGNADPIKIAAQAKGMAELAEELRGSIESEAMNEADKYKGSSVYGCKVELSNTGVKIDLDADPDYAELKEKLKRREDLLKCAFKSKDPVIDGETGEVVPAPPVKNPSKQTLKLTINKE